MQSIDAIPFRGKRVRYRAAVRTQVQGPANQAQLWFRVDRQSPAGGRSVGAFDNMGDRPITAANWQHYEIVGNVADDAQRIFLGILMQGVGKAWIDDASIEVVGNDVVTTGRPVVGSSTGSAAPGVFEVRGSMRLTPNEPVLAASEVKDKDGRWKDTSLTVLLPIPLAYRDQIPLSYELSVDPPHAADSVEIYEDRPQNYVAKLVLADVHNRERIDVQFRSAVLVGPTGFDDVPRSAAIPKEWPKESEPWLAATWCADANHERIQAIAKEIRRDTDDVMRVIDRVQQRTKEIFQSASGHVSSLTAVQALDKTGSCTSCANLVAAVLRGSGVPARILSGYPSWSGPLQTHYIVEAYVPHYGWYPIESTRSISPWPNFQQVNVAIIPPDYEEQSRAKSRYSAAPGVPYLSLTETPENLVTVLRRGTISDEKPNCDHVCQQVRKIEAQPAAWQSAMHWADPRWRQWLTGDHQLFNDGKVSFSKPADQISSEFPAALLAELEFSELPKPPARKPVATAAAPSGRLPSLNEIFAQLDSDRDGRIAKAEAVGPYALRFSGWDINRDEFADRQEIRVFRARAGIDDQGLPTRAAGK
ncbi:MAG TPA: transglutaminase family protein [Pirellulaceae bacterium]